MEVDKIRQVSGRESFREVVEHPGGVCILPVDDDGTCYMVRQYRYPVQKHLLEAPAGKLEKGEDPLDCAVRELGEETGFTAGRMIPLGGFYTSPGFSTEKLYLYVATDLRQGEQHPDEGELLDLVKMPLAELKAAVLRGEIEDGKTATLVLAAEQLL